MSGGDHGGTGRPAPVRIDDLSDPQFTPDVRVLLDAMTELAPTCVLERDALLEAAVAQEGLDDFGDADDPGFGERLDVIATAYRTEGNLSPWGTVSIRTQLVGMLANRLRVTDLLARHPEIRDVPITAPIIIAGLPRTGTTHLQNVLAADPELRSLPYWESLEPVPPAAELAHPTTPDPRLARTQLAVDVADAAMPYFKRMHEMTVDHVHEEIQLLAVDLSTMYFETLALLPSWRDYYQAHDQTPHYRYLRTLLQVCTWLRRDEGLGTRWVLKTPQHLEQFAVLDEVFGDATFVVTHREPVAITLSMANMIAYTARMQVAHPDPVAIGRYWSDRAADLLEACERDRDLLPADRSIDVRLDDLVADEMGVVEQIYDLAGQPLGDRSRAAIEDYLATHVRGRHGVVIVEPEVLGIDVAERRAALSSYAHRFGVAGEVRPGAVNSGFPPAAS